jgi:predicted Zn-dependent protease
MRQGYIAGLALALGMALGTTGCSISTEKEVQMGEQYSKEIAKQLPLISDPDILSYLTQLGGSLAKVADDRNLTWSFHLVDSKEINAFAIPGGFIYVNRGLVEHAENMSQLAGVLGHEIGHVTRRHSVKQMEKQRGATGLVLIGCIAFGACNSGLAEAGINVVGGVVFAKFSRNDESEADREGVKTTIRAGIDPNGIPEMFEILLKERKERPDMVSALLASHPLEEDRVKQARALIATYDQSVLGDLRKDDDDFHLFKQRVLALPPSPDPKRK